MLTQSAFNRAATLGIENIAPLPSSDNQAYRGGGRNNPQAEANTGRLLTYWRQIRLPTAGACNTEPISFG
jgi:hypothetical protein